MRKFTLRLLVFIIPVLCWFIIEGLLPPNTFTIGHWESLRFQTVFGLDRNFYPQTTLQMESVGELCHHTKYAIKSNTIWKVDKLGNRNDFFIEDPDILIIGDSHVVGEGVSQNSIFSNQLKSALKDQIKVYNIAPASFSRIDFYLKAKLIKKPKTIIYIRAERYVPQPLIEYCETNSLKSRLKTTLRNNATFSNLCIFMDKSFRLYSISWLKARISNKKGLGMPGINGSNMFFLDPESLKNERYLVCNIHDVVKVKDNILTYKEYCDALDIKFIFLSIPEKKNVYYDFVPFEKQANDYAFLLDSMLVANNITTINLLKLFNEYRGINTKILYQLDDPHMNTDGIKLVSSELAKIVKTTKQ